MQQWKTLTVTHLAAVAAGFFLAPREMLETDVKSGGFFTTDTRRVLSATVDSLRSENRLQVFSYKGSATVSVSRSKFVILKGQQTLIVPATVGYYLNMSQLTLDKVSYDERSKIVTVKLPPLVTGDIAFQPEAAQTINGGILTFGQDQVDELSKLNYNNARRAVVKQTQSPTLIAAAQTEAKKDVQANFEIPLRITGQPDVKVVAVFDQ